MSRRPDRRRDGTALLVVIVIAAMAGLATLALWRTAAGAARTDAMATAVPATAGAADSALLVGLAAVERGDWRDSLPTPGSSMVAGQGSGRRTRWRATVGRTGWAALVVRGTGSGASGARGVMSRADHRVLVPLVSPLPMPEAALTGSSPWLVVAGAVVDVPPPAPAELSCRDGLLPVGQATAPYPDSAMARLVLPLLDPDTVRAPMSGAFRLTGGRIRVPLRIAGMVVLDTDLSVEADLRLTGVLIVRGTVRTAGGRLDVRGATISGDAYGGHSGLGAADRVRYDACAIRHAVERVTAPASAHGRTPFRLF
ncbi:MAG: hypothetical protein IT355_08670 [Gemmatimonadaceae bacterium]|nr:hypothetical protein [Gemmatimonadaceae bacterium]